MFTGKVSKYTEEGKIVEVSNYLSKLLKEKGAT